MIIKNWITRKANHFKLKKNGIKCVFKRNITRFRFLLLVRSSLQTLKWKLFSKIKKNKKMHMAFHQKISNQLISRRNEKQFKCCENMWGRLFLCIFSQVCQKTIENSTDFYVFMLEYITKIGSTSVRPFFFHKHFKNNFSHIFGKIVITFLVNIQPWNLFLFEITLENDCCYHQIKFLYLAFFIFSFR